MRAWQIRESEDFGASGKSEIWRGALGKTITGLVLLKEGDYFWEDSLVFTFEDGSRVRLFDNGQDCCEHRWMHTDDVLADFVGAVLLGAEVRDGPKEETEEEYHESQFLIVSTNLGAFTMVNYNVHNGYYGGFALRAERIDKQEVLQ